MKKLAVFISCVLVSALLTAPLSAQPADDVSSAASTSSASSQSTDSQPQEQADAGAAGTTATSGSSFPPPFADKLHSRAIYMVNLDSGAVVYERNSQEQISPASLTKIMTCIVALENVANPENETTSLKAYIQNELYKIGGVTLGGIYMGEELSIKDLMYAMMLPSANEAAMMVADYVGDGSQEAFVEMMNAKAKEIGALNTHFSNATGLYDENNYSTAYDMALIARYAMQNPDFVEIVTTRAYTSQPTPRYPDGIPWYSSNYMQIQSHKEYYYEGLKGIKTGTLPAQNMRNFISTASRDGYSYLLVVMGAPTKDDKGQRYQYNLAFWDTRDLYNWAFETFTVKTLMNIGDEVSEVAVRLSWDVDNIKLLAADKFAALVPKETTEDALQAIPDIPAAIDAPIKKGDVVGTARLMLGGEEIGRVRLVAAQSVQRSEALYYISVVKSFMSNFLFKLAVSFVGVVIVLYIILMLVRNHNRRRYRMRRRPSGRR